MRKSKNTVLLFSVAPRFINRGPHEVRDRVGRAEAQVAPMLTGSAVMRPCCRTRPKLLLYIKTRTGLIGKLPMTVHRRTRELPLQLRHQLLHRYPLQDRSGVVGLAFLVESALVADADRVCVLTLAMCALLSQRSPCVDRATAVNKKVIADSLEPSLLMPASDSLHIHSLPWQGRAAMQNNLVNASHTMVTCWLGISCAVICIVLACLLSLND